MKLSKRNIPDVLIVLGMLMITIGLFMINITTGMIGTGSLLIASSITIAKGGV